MGLCLNLISLACVWVYHLVLDELELDHQSVLEHDLDRIGGFFKSKYWLLVDDQNPVDACKTLA